MNFPPPFTQLIQCFERREAEDIREREVVRDCSITPRKLSAEKIGRSVNGIKELIGIRC